MDLKGRDDIDFSIRRVGDLVFIGVYTTKRCNLNCIYCFEDAGIKDENEIMTQHRLDVINQAADMGSETLFIAGAGEPLLDEGFEDIIKLSNNLGLTSLIYTNGTLITREKAKMLFENNVAPIVKLESLDAKIHDTLTATIGSHEKAMKGIRNLLNAGYGKLDSNITDIAIAALYTKLNVDSLYELNDYCKKHNIKLICDVLGVHGRAKSSQIVPPKKINELQKELGFETGKMNQTPCLFWQYGLIIDHLGYARYCSEIPTEDIGHISNKSIKELNYIKNIKYPPHAGCFTCPVKEKSYMKMDPALKSPALKYPRCTMGTTIKS